LLIGDETALPAINRRLEELPSGASALAVVEVDDFDWPSPESRAGLEVVWVKRDSANAAPAHVLMERLRTLALPPENCFAWVALESQSARAIRRYLREERGIEKQWIKAAAYWQRGEAGVHDRIED
jgi:NADPH-dependent ferric siderophore reductase